MLVLGWLVVSVLKSVGFRMNTNSACYPMQAHLQDKLLGQQIALDVITRDFRKNIAWENRYQVLMLCWSNRQATILGRQMSGGVKDSDSKNCYLWF